jgi:hypothetical protein
VAYAKDTSAPGPMRQILGPISATASILSASLNPLTWKTQK